MWATALSRPLHIALRKPTVSLPVSECRSTNPSVYYCPNKESTHTQCCIWTVRIS